jgi:Leucine-rich repeat (LRR) protein
MKLWILCSLVILICWTGDTAAFYDFTGNSSLEEIPTDIPANTSVISIWHSSISTIRSKAFAAYTDLEILILPFNLISDVADDAFDGTMILWLDLSYNRQTSGPNLSSIAPYLVFLALDYNQISSFHRSYFTEMSNLEMLWLSGNQLTAMPVFQDLNFVRLHLEDNLITLEQENFTDFTVERLYLTNNTLEDISPLSQLSKSLRVLSLAESNLLNIQAIDIYNLLDSLPNLEQLELANCRLRTFPDVRTIHRNISLTLSLGGNLFDCDCRLAWMLDNSTNFVLRGDVFCISPPQFAGSNLLTGVKKNELCPSKFTVDQEASHLSI